MASATEELVVQSPGGGSIAGDNKKREASPEPDAGDSAAQEAARKKKKTGPGSRGVANLTPEQLAKKRENDREAQRAIRKRTKEQIETLERRIQELTSQQPYQELLAVQRAKEAVEQENIEIKRRLATIIGELQPLLGNISDPSRLYASPSQTYAPSVPNVAPPPAPMSVHNASTPGSVPSPSSTDIGSQSWQSAGNQGEQARIQLNQQRHEMRHGLDMGPERLGLNFLLENNQRVARIHNGADSAQDTPRYHHVPMRHDWTDNRNDQALRVRPGSGGGRWEASPRTPSTTGPTSRPSQMARDAPSPHYSPNPAPGSPQWTLPIKNCAPTCPLDYLLLDFLNERRQRAAEGLPVQEVVGPRYPSVSSLLNPANSAFSHPLSKVFTDILSTFPDISTLPERIAVLYVMFLLMRWQISPTQANWERLPEWFRPTHGQLTIDHPAWVDHIPFPVMREKIVQTQETHEIVFDNFFIPFTTTLNLSWPYEDTDALLQGPDGDEVVINPVFERHLRNLKNWSLGERFVKAFPFLAEGCNVGPPPSRPR
ncbi:unnamed protein product [Clonostachys byssicola]|uniref:BZIP transcription factor n=1 Tax=Clonostachys byssicola TaxID=160290 RepID=A0A9N9YAX0_9HYPO|nr:unnamed protein product [Clonostachys byssicola]